MCEFFSWIETVDGNVHHLQDSDLFRADGDHTDHARELLEGSQDRDFIGHHATEAFWGPKSQGVHRETQNIWDPKELPKKLHPLFKDGATVINNFGKMISKYVDYEGLEYLMYNAPQNEEWQSLRDFADQTLRVRRQNSAQRLIKQAKVRKFTLQPDTRATISEVLKLGKYDWENGGINNKNFPTQPTTDDAQAFLIDFQESVLSFDAGLAIDSLGYRPATARETLRFGKDHPDIQRKNWVVGLGEEAPGLGGSRGVVVLGGDVGGRSASLLSSAGLESYFHFLVFRK